MCIRDIPVPVYQDEGELNQLRQLVREHKPARILEIGSLFGGTLWAWMQDAPGATIVSVDIGVQSFDYRHEEVEAARHFWPTWERATGCTLVQMRSDSTVIDTIDAVRAYGPFDFIFIDGGHWFQVAMADFQNYWPMLRPGGLLAMHDIAYPDNNPDNYGVAAVWRQVRENGEWREIIRPNNPEGIWGIGVVVKGGE
jgi:predicted O-methyltransferase YrrM